jgi:cytochrome c556
MLRKWTTLVASMAAITLLATSLSVADEDSPLHKLMEKVNSTNLAITKACRTSVNFKKGQKDVVKNAQELAKLAKTARAEEYSKDPVAKAKASSDPVAKAKGTPDNWTKIMDDFAKAAENLAEVAEKPSTTNVEAKAAHTAVKKTCTECHAIFRVEEDKF